MSKKHVISAIIIDDDEDDYKEINNKVVPSTNNNNIDDEIKDDEIKDAEIKDDEIKDNEVKDVKIKKKKIVTPKKQEPLKIAFELNDTNIELGIDEAGRGPMFGRVYAGVVVLPKDNTFDHSLMKDSKKFHSKKKIEEVAEYIKENAIAWAVEYEDEDVIDDINILQATQSAMHKGIRKVLHQLNELDVIEENHNNILLLVDGSYFKPFSLLNKTKTKLDNIKYYTVVGGDNKYTSIAAASILAKVERDRYIDNLCNENPELVTHYGIDSNKGYGSKIHMDGIKQHGITKWHRKTFGICRNYC